MDKISDPHLWPLGYQRKSAHVVVLIHLKTQTKSNTWGRHGEIRQPYMPTVGEWRTHSKPTWFCWEVSIQWNLLILTEKWTKLSKEPFIFRVECLVLLCDVNFLKKTKTKKRVWTQVPYFLCFLPSQCVWGQIPVNLIKIDR